MSVNRAEAICCCLFLRLLGGSALKTVRKLFVVMSAALYFFMLFNLNIIILVKLCGSQELLQFL